MLYVLTVKVETMVQLQLIDKGPVYTRSRVQLLNDIAEKMGYYIQFTDGCCEPGYEDKPVALANWNSRTKYDPATNTFKTLDNTMPRLAKLFEKLGYGCEWEDEWFICGSCGKTVRSQPDSYSWQPYYWLSDCGVTCGDCTRNDPTDYLDFLSGNARHCLTFDIDISKYRYKLLQSGYEIGLWLGLDDDSEEIAKQLREKGVEDFIFVMDSTGQFGCTFSVWVKQ
jgi:hypothetical protein